MTSSISVTEVLKRAFFNQEALGKTSVKIYLVLRGS